MWSICRRRMEKDPGENRRLEQGPKPHFADRSWRLLELSANHFTNKPEQQWQNQLSIAEHFHDVINTNQFSAITIIHHSFIALCGLRTLNYKANQNETEM